MNNLIWLYKLFIKTIYKSENINTYKNIDNKVREFIILNDNDIGLLKTLSREQLISIIEVNNLWTETINHYILHDINTELKNGD